MFHRFVLVPLVIASIVAGCASHPHTPASVPAPDAPDALHYEDGNGLSGESMSIDVRQGFVTLQFINHNPYTDQKSVVIRRKPSEKEWQDFWKEIAPLRIWEWKPSYSMSDLRPRLFISDASDWKFSCRRGSLHVQSEGYAVEPKLGRPQGTVLWSESQTLNRLLNALSRLAELPVIEAASQHAHKKTRPEGR